MKEITYTFIIPHHNCPDLLDRCLSSIPQRDDIQIVVVDDNSDADKKPIECGRPEVEYIYIDKNYTKGAGRARNVGLSRAKGKWLLFPDSDDYYNEDFIEVLDHYKNSDIDVLYFNYTFIDGISEKILPSNALQKVIDSFDQTKEKEDIVRYQNNTPWTKMIKSDFITKIGAYYEEVPNGNDVLFSLWVGHLANKIAVNGKCVYNYIKTPNSLGTKKQSTKDLICRITHVVKHNAFNIKIGHKEWNINPCKYIALLIYRMKFKEAMDLIKTLILELSSLFASRNEWINLVLDPID